MGKSHHLRSTDACTLRWVCLFGPAFDVREFLRWRLLAQERAKLQVPRVVDHCVEADDSKTRRIQRSLTCLQDRSHRRGKSKAKTISQRSLALCLSEIVVAQMIQSGCERPRAMKASVSDQRSTWERWPCFSPSHGPGPEIISSLLENKYSSKRLLQSPKSDVPAHRRSRKQTAQARQGYSGTWLHDE